MSKLSQIIQSKFSSREGILDVRIKTAKIFFVFTVLLFSLNYFFIGAGFYDELGIIWFPYTYIIFITSFVFLLHLMLVKKFLVKKNIIFSFILLALLIFIFSAMMYYLFL